MTFPQLNRRALLSALCTSLLPIQGHTAEASHAWNSSYAPYNGPLKPALASGPMRVQGRWPKKLKGILYRVGPARRELGGVTMDHWFDGDGMLQAFSFEDGLVSHRGAMLATPKLKGDEAAGRFVNSGFATALSDTPPLMEPDSVNPANINVLHIPTTRELLALWEGGSALAVDPATLRAGAFRAWSPETKGAPFSAHPRVAPDGTVWSFGYMPGTNRLLVYEISPQGRLRRQHLIVAPQADLVHDFAITARHLVFLLMPMQFQGHPGAGNLLDKYRWDDQAPLVALLVAKADFRVQRFELPATGVFHLANAWEEGDMVQVRFVAQPDLLNMMRGLVVNNFQSHVRAGATQWTHITLNPVTGQASMQSVGPTGIEFPRIHPARNGLPTRFTTLLSRSRAMDARVLGFDSVLTLDGERQKCYHYGDGWIVEEHVYVPAHPMASEGCGWVIGTAYHWPTERTALSVFDAQAVDAGPIARVNLPYGLPLGLHGQFVPSGA